MTFIPTLALYTPTLSAPVESPGETDRYNVPTVFSGYISPVLVPLPLAFVKSPRNTLGLVQCAHPLQTSLSLSHPDPVPPSNNTPKPPSSSTNTHKPISSKIKSFPKQFPTINNPTDPPNHPQIIFTYPPSASSLPPPQTQHTISPLTQSSFHLLLPLETTFEMLIEMLETTTV